MAWPRCWFGFEVGPGPAFHVYLVPKASIRSSSDLKDAKFVDLGGLRSFKGSQRYAIPPGVNPTDIKACSSGASASACSFPQPT